MQVVWLKRDLRIHDHQPLWEAAKHGPVLLLYILEPMLWRQPDMSRRHYLFLSECVEDLSAQLKQQGCCLTVRVGEVLDVLEPLSQHEQIDALWSYQETWNGWTYKRDQRVKRWARARGLPWHELPQQGIGRGRQNREGWAQQWYATMRQPLVAQPRVFETMALSSDAWPSPDVMGLQPDGCLRRQHGGRQQALRLLEGFLHVRGKTYTRAMSSPNSAWQACSRLSPYLAFGVISLREVFQMAEQRRRDLPDDARMWRQAMRSFQARLRWRAHFMQKLETQPSIEYQSMHSAYEDLRSDGWRQDAFEAWCAGQTGYPLVDACMRALTQTGWLNFRMRAMLVSFASYHLWLDWRPTAEHLARLFLDYEPGIHYAQIQMQSGTTGTNAIRIYNPIKQSMDQDPQGHFIRRYVPELTSVSDAAIHTPWMMEHDLDYPPPLVDEAQARREASHRLYRLRGSSQHREEAQRVLATHSVPKQRRSSKRKSASPQTELPI